jgi:hypothetical protein
MTKPHLIVIGNGMAGCRAVEEILERDAGRFRITIFGAEPRVAPEDFACGHARDSIQDGIAEWVPRNRGFKPLYAAIEAWGRTTGAGAGLRHLAKDVDLR